MDQKDNMTQNRDQNHSLRLGQTGDCGFNDARKTWEFLQKIIIFSSQKTIQKHYYFAV